MVKQCAIRAWGNRASLGAAALALGALAPALGQAPPAAEGLSQKEASKELQALHDDDQRDQASADAETISAAFSARQATRRNRVVELLELGLLATPRDYNNAALLMQHGVEIDDFLISHVLSSAAVFEGGDPLAEFMCAASLDRFLMYLKQPQRFGTQSSDAAGKNLEDFTPSIGNAVRLAYKLDPLPKETWAELGAPASKSKKTPGPKELANHFKSLQKDSKALADGDAKALERQRERCAWVLEAVQIGELAKDEELYQAASILYSGETPEQLLHAHILAVGAAFKGHPDGKRLSAATLDRWLLSLKRPQRFGTQSDKGAAGAPLEPWDKTLHDVVRKAYGLTPLNPEPKGGKKAK
jgi:hypothetical protein